MEHWGGGEEFLLKIFNNINEFEFILSTPDGLPANVFQQSDIKVIIINSLKKIYRGNESWTLSSVIKIITNIIISTVQLIKVILKYKIDFILCNGNFAGLYCILASTVTLKKMIVVQHLLYKKDSFEGKMVFLINKFAYKMVCISDSVFYHVKQILGKNDKDKLITIYHGITLPVINEKDNEISYIQKKIVNIGIVGSLIKIKGIDLLIEAIKDIITYNRNVHVHIFGTVRKNDVDSIKYESELKEQIKRYRINENVHFHGFEKSKDTIYSNLDIVVNYSTIAESFAFTVIEAMAYKKIVIATAVGGPKEIITDGYNGFLLPASEEKKLREKLDYCIKDLNSSEFQKIRENARKTVEQNYALSQFIQNYKIFFNSVFTRF